MTTHKLTFCKHCGIRHSFQGSGWGAPEYNDEDYCQECKKTIVDALKNIPKKAEMRFIPSKDFTEKEFKEKLEEHSVRRTWPGLFDLKNGEVHDSQHNVGLNINGQLYRGSWWEKAGRFELSVETYHEFTAEDLKEMNKGKTRYEILKEEK